MVSDESTLWFQMSQPAPLHRGGALRGRGAALAVGTEVQQHNDPTTPALIAPPAGFNFQRGGGCKVDPGLA